MISNNKNKYSILLIIILCLVFSSLIVAIPEFEPSGTLSRIIEDSGLFYYNLSKNTTIDGGDPDDTTINYQVLSVNSTLYPDQNDFSFYTWIELNESNGMLTINATSDNHSGEFNLSVFVQNLDSLGESRPFYYAVNATNDAPIFLNIFSNYTLMQDNLFLQFINSSDEINESHYPISFNLTWNNSCIHAIFASKDNCNLFNITNASDRAILMNFTPTIDDVGVYYANISITDSGENFNCPTSFCSPDYSENKTTYYSTLIEFVVQSYLSINVSDCQNKVFYENQSNSCMINITTVGENDLLEISTNSDLRNNQDYSYSIYNGSWFYSDNSTNSSQFISSIYVNVTPMKNEVGNWTINFSVNDITTNESSIKLIYIYVNRTYNGLPNILPVNDILTSINYENTINLTVFDDDLLIRDKNEQLGGYNETINFTVQIFNKTDLGQQLSLNGFDVEIINMPESETNKTNARIIFTPDENEVGSYFINITVNDLENSYDSINFNITIFNNNPPLWDESMNTTIIYYQGNNTYLNLSANITDPDNDLLSYTYAINKNYSSFNLNLSGYANFTNTNFDVGEHLINITASDGYLTNTTTINITVYNINDNPIIEIPLSATNATTGETQVSCTEDNYTVLYLWVQDDDFLIPISQQGFYFENITINLTINGNNPNLFSFIQNPNFPPIAYTGNNRSQYYSIFTPNKSDIGTYNISINITDNSNLSFFYEFNLTVFEINHAPIIMDLKNFTLTVNNSIYYRINSSDIEDGNTNQSTHNLTYNYNFISGNDFINNNKTIFNITSGELNYSFNDSEGGNYLINISVNDSLGVIDKKIFSIKVYDIPNINFPNISDSFILSENVTTNIIFQASHGVMDNLTYLIYIENNDSFELKKNISFYGNLTNYSWEYTPSFTDSINNGNLTLIVFSSNNDVLNRSNLNYTQNWNLTIKNKNYPLSFSGLIGGLDYIIQGTTPLSITLSDFFEDLDASDIRYNQTIGFNYSLVANISGGISVGIINWTNGTTPVITFTSTTAASANYSVTGFEYNISNLSQIINSVKSNNFTVILNLSVSEGGTEGDASESSGSGGGGSSSKRVYEPEPMAFKLIFPGEIISYPDQKIEIPITIINKGDFVFKGIKLTKELTFNNLLDLTTYNEFDIDNIEKLSPGESENVSLTMILPENIEGEFNIMINATSVDPKYSDWGMIKIKVVEFNKSETEEILIFVEEFIASNPECIEIMEIVKEAEKLYEKGEYNKARKKTEQAIKSCKEAIMQVGLLKKKQGMKLEISEIVIIVSIVSVLLGFGYYYFKRRSFRKKIQNTLETKDNKKIPNSEFRG